jgi:hypothetical protein
MFFDILSFHILQIGLNSRFGTCDNERRLLYRQLLNPSSTLLKVIHEPLAIINGKVGLLDLHDAKSG